MKLDPNGFQRCLERFTQDEESRKFKDNCFYFLESPSQLLKDEKWKTSYQEIVDFVNKVVHEKKSLKIEEKYFSYDILIGMLRGLLTENVSWCLFDFKAADLLVDYLKEKGINKILDPLAGNGFAGKLLSRAGFEVDCYDIDPPLETWFPVKKMDATEIDMDLYQNSALLCSWVPMSDIGEVLIKSFQGEVIIWIGESYGGCTGNGTDLELLEKNWSFELEIPIACYPGINDRLFIYKRV